MNRLHVLWPGRLLVTFAFLAWVLVSGAPRLALASNNTTDMRFKEPNLQISSIEQHDLDADGNLDQAIIRGGFITGNDLLTVFDSQDDMVASTDWQDVIHFDHATLVFDAEADGKNELVIFFQREGEKHHALLFDDRDGDGQVSYLVTGNQPEITEMNESGEAPVYPTLRVEAAGPWLLADGRAQSNITFLIDGFVPAQVIATYPEFLNSYFANDGKIDFEVEVVDSNMDGDLDYELLRLLQPLPESYQPFRTLIFKKEGASKTAPPNGFLFWPFLNFAARFESSNYLDSPPTIDMDWARGRINRAGIWGYPTEAGWHVTSFLPVAKGQANNTNFETPMAYYDLAEDQDGIPELHVRVEYQVPYGAEASNTSYGMPNEQIRYTWAQEVGDAPAWDYKLGLFGRHAVSTEVAFPDFRIRTIPYLQLPGWVAQNTWDAAIFIAREGRPFYSSEGIYFGDPFEPANWPYLFGETAEPPVVTQDLIEPGWRAEYSWNLDNRPLLYLSPVDLKLHLKGAEEGFWWIYQSNSTIEYESMNGLYFDHWRLTRDGVETESLYLSNKLFIYADAETQALRILKDDSTLSVFETLPPTNNGEWLALGQKLKDYNVGLEQTNLAAMLEQFAGPSTAILGASLRDFRLIDGGFRFVLGLQPGFSLQGEDWLGLLGQPAGEYAVAYQDGRFQVQPLTPARPALAPGSLRLAASPVALRPNRLSAVLLNQGLADARSVAVSLTALGPDGQPQLVETQHVDLLSGVETPLSFSWTPPAPGPWQLALSLGEAQSGAAPLGEALLVQVPPLSPPGWRWALEGFGAAHSAWALAAFTLALALLAAVLVFQVLNHARR